MRLMTAGNEQHADAMELVSGGLQEDRADSVNEPWVFADEIFLIAGW
jgi:hypothetical protein